jgi:FkbM family methyltransferase
MIPRIIGSVRYRAKMASFGIYYLRSPDLRTVRVGGRTVKLVFPETEAAEQKWELGRLLFDDCYGLAGIRHPVATALDIGANVGFFALAARRHFPKAVIHCYEPNRDLEPSLVAHCCPIGAKYFLTAVGAEESRIDLQPRGGTMHSVTKEAPNGQIQQVAFRDAVSRLGAVDLLKLDCEGAEWEIFSDPAPWSRVRSVTMEYHLWAKPGSTTGHIEERLRSLGFGYVVIEPSANGPWGFARASRV